MISVLFKQTFRFIFFIVLQIVVLNHIQFNGYINPYLYIFIIMMLPFTTPVWLVLLLSFLSGLLIDMFQDSMGMHAAATVFMGYARSFVLKLFSPREGYEDATEPTLNYLGASWYFSYTLIMVLIHHFTYFIIEAFSFGNFKMTLLRITASGAFTVILVFIAQMLVHKPKDAKKN